MNEPDSLDALLRDEWKSPAPSADLDQRVTSAYRSAMKPSAWRRFWGLKFTVPAPALVAATLVVVALFFWLRPAPPPDEAPAVSTRVNATGFQPLPNGEARILPAVQTRNLEAGK